MQAWLRRKDIDQVTVHEEGRRLVPTLSWPHLVALGIGAIVGTGIYTLIGVGANLAGPGVLVSFLVAGIAKMASRRSLNAPTQTRSSAGQPEHAKELGVGRKSPSRIRAIAPATSCSRLSISTRRSRYRAFALRLGVPAFAGFLPGLAGWAGFEVVRRGALRASLWGLRRSAPFFCINTFSTFGRASFFSAICCSLPRAVDFSRPSASGTRVCWTCLTGPRLESAPPRPPQTTHRAIRRRCTERSRLR